MAVGASLKLKLQVLRGERAAIGPGKAMVMEAIARAGSISGAGRDLGMSYRRIWLLVEALNADWVEPVVLTRVGGGRQGGARLSAFGEQLLADYRAVEATMLAAAPGAALTRMQATLRPPSTEAGDHEA